MADSFKDKVSAHLDAAQKSIADVSKAAQDKKRDANAYLDKFDVLAKKIIEPVFMSARDELLGRNKPSDVVLLRDRESEPPYSYIGLHCSTEIGDMRTVRDSPQFKVFFKSENHGVWQPNIQVRRNDPAHVFCKIEDVTTEKVESAVLAFLKAYFPAR